MKWLLAVAFVLVLPWCAFADGHGPVFGLATPTNSKGEWSFDSGVFGRSNSFDTEASFREQIGYGFTPHLSLFFTAPVVFGNAVLTPTRIQPGDDFEAKLAWRFQHRATKVGTRFESTAFVSLVSPGPQSGFPGIAHTTNAPGTMFGAVTGMASRSHYVWLGSTFTKFYKHSGDKRPDVLDYSLVYGYRPLKWRRPPDKWDWRVFGELAGERSTHFLQSGVEVPQSQTNQVFLGPTVLGIFRNYTVSFGAQFPIYQNVGSLYPKEHVRFGINFSYLLFQHHAQ
ncbi:MAG: hypothetical protein JSS69_12850 [Acidobacteria bacterium]|nr:hypothetical protein [Acidobacteriota bacterium]MBS1866795.1 hypothetical protein [Acidobacteriota bacterium]